MALAWRDVLGQIQALQGVLLTDERVQRRLVAVLAADVAGYATLMGEDEEGTLRELKAIRQTIIDPTIATHRGRIVKTTGDGMLVEFASAVDAVTGAVAIQAAMADRSTTADGGPRIVFRIGINVGDIIIDAGDIFGDDVNIAARVEAECEPGCVYLTATAFEQVRGKAPFSFDDLGQRQLKNIDRPIRLYAARTGDTDVAGRRKRTVAGRIGASDLALPDKPSIAVLPFQNMSGDPDQDYFADGLVEDIITDLSRFRGLFVIARNSAFTYKGKAIDIKQVGRELGVRYVLEGSVRKAASRLRITGQLIDVTTGTHLWAERFDGALDDVFELQDQVTQQVVGAIAPELDRAEIERMRRSVGNVDALTEYYRGLPHIHFPTTPDNNDRALGHFRNAMTLDPSFAPANGGAASCFWWRRANRWPCDKAEDDAELLRFAERVKELGTDDAITLSSIGFGLFHNGVDYDGGIEMVDRAIRSNPNFAQAYVARGSLRVWDGASDTAIADFEQSMRLSPRDPFTFAAMSGLAFGHHNAARYAEAAGWADKAVRAFPYFFSGLRTAIMCYVNAERLDDAKRLMADCLRLNPDWRLSTMEWNGVRAPAVRAKMLEAFVAAGLPE